MTEGVRKKHSGGTLPSSQQPMLNLGVFLRGNSFRNLNEIWAQKKWYGLITDSYLTKDLKCQCQKSYTMERTDIWLTEGIHASSSGGCSVRVTSWKIQSGCCQSPSGGAEPPMLFSKVPAEESRGFTKSFSTKSTNLQRAQSTAQTFTKVLPEKYHTAGQ